MSSTWHPEIKVLENRAAKLSSIIQEFQGYKYQNKSKTRLAQVADLLRQCADDLDGIIDHRPESVAMSPPIQADSKEVTHSSCNSDLDDTIDLSILQPPTEKILIPNPDKGQYTPKYILYRYTNKFRSISKYADQASVTGIKEVDEFMSLLASWFFTRYSNASKDPGYGYSACTICKWVDLLIVAGGLALYQAKYSEFVYNCKRWLDQLNHTYSNINRLPAKEIQKTRYPIPYSVKKLDSDLSACTLHAILIEKLVKPHIYDKSFYFNRMCTIEDIYLNSMSCPYSKEELTVDMILDIYSNSFTNSDSSSHNFSNVRGAM